MTARLEVGEARASRGADGTVCSVTARFSCAQLSLAAGSSVFIGGCSGCVLLPCKWWAIVEHMMHPAECWFTKVLPVLPCNFARDSNANAAAGSR